MCPNMPNMTKNCIPPVKKVCSNFFPNKRVFKIQFFSVFFIFASTENKIALKLDDPDKKARKLHRESYKNTLVCSNRSKVLILTPTNLAHFNSNFKITSQVHWSLGYKSCISLQLRLNFFLSTHTEAYT